MVLRFFCCIVLLFNIVACNQKSSSTDINFETTASASSLYTLHCAACHGEDGKKGISGAADLSSSKLSDKEIRNTIVNGNDKGMMPFKDLITKPAEIDSLVSFVKTLRK
jgi:cytochrome c6